VLTSEVASLALACGAVVLLIGIAWAVRASRADGRRLVPRRRSHGVVSAILVLDGCALMLLGVLAGPWGGDGGTGDPGRPLGGTAPAAGAGGGAGAAATLVPVPVPEQAAPPAPRRARALLVARLAGDGSPGQGDADGRGAVRLDVRPAAQHLCFDMAVDDGIAGSITSASVFRAATPGAPAHLTLVVPDDKTPRRRRGCAARPPVEALRAVVDAPERFYVQLANEAYPDGAVRGALAPCRTPCRARAPQLLR
jgi:hypothetical protein